MVPIKRYLININTRYVMRTAEVAELSDEVGTGAQSYGIGAGNFHGDARCGADGCTNAVSLGKICLILKSCSILIR